MPCRRSASVRAGPGGGRPSCMPTRATTSPTAGGCCANERSFRGSPGVASKAASVSAGTDGWSSVRSLGLPASAASPSATNGAPTSSLPFTTSRPASSAGASSRDGSVLMFAVKGFGRACPPWLRPGAGFRDAHGRRRGRRRRLSKLSCAGWLPHDRGFVPGLPRSRSERRSGRLITEREGSPTAPRLQPWAPAATSGVVRKPDAAGPHARSPTESRPSRAQWPW